MEQILDQFLGKYRIKLDPQYGIDKHIIEKGSWEGHIVQFLQFWVRPGFVCVDVGANAGYHTLAMAGQTGVSGKVYAFEPNDLILPRLFQNIDLNPALKSSIIVRKMALSDKPGELKVFQSGENLGNAYVSAEYNEKYWNTGAADDFQICPVNCLDLELEGERIDLIKIDVEGMELQVLKGASNILSIHQPTIIFETLVATFDQENIKATAEFLIMHGYMLFGFEFNFGKLVPVKFPYFQEDTFAIHKTKVIEGAEILVNAALFRPSPADASPDNQISEMVVLCLNGSDIFVRTDLRSGGRINSDSLMRTGNSVSLNYNNILGAAQIDFDSHLPHQLTVRFSQNGVEKKLHMSKVGGDLRI